MYTISVIIPSNSFETLKPTMFTQGGGRLGYEKPTVSIV